MENFKFNSKEQYENEMKLLLKKIKDYKAQEEYDNLVDEYLNFCSMKQNGN